MADDSDNDLDLLNALINDEDSNPSPTPPQSTPKKSPKASSSKNFDLDFLSLQTNSPPPQEIVQSNARRPPTSPIKFHTNSSDEENDYFEKPEYSSCGREIHELLKEKEKEGESSSTHTQKSPKSNFGDLSFSKSKNAQSPSVNIMKRVQNPEKSSDIKKLSQNGGKTAAAPSLNSASTNVYSDPIFGFGLNKPLISSAALIELMEGRKAVKIADLDAFLRLGKPSEDFVVAGVLTYKAPARKSVKGDSFAIWRLSDMTMEMNSISLFLFRNAFQKLWKISEGSVLGILNPNVLENRDKNDSAALSVDNPARVMIMGTSRDLGKCKSIKKNGEGCSSMVNLRLCEYCVYHVKTEYSKHSKRTDLASFGARGLAMSGNQKKNNNNSTINRHAKVNEVSFIPAKKNEKMISRDKERLEKLKSNSSISSDIKKEEVKEIKKETKIKVELTEKQNKKDFERLQKLKNSELITEKVENTEDDVGKTFEIVEKNIKPKTVLDSAPKTAARFNLSNLNSKKIELKSPLEQKNSKTFSIMTPKEPKNTETPKISFQNGPKLGAGFFNGTIDLSAPIPKRKVEMAKKNAVEWIKQNGGIKPSNPNKILASKEAQQNLKRKREEEKEKEEEDEMKRKKSNTNSFAEEFKKLMEVKSNHKDLLKKAEDEAQEKYFDKLEIKERMETKMLSTFQVACKAVFCQKCNYTAFSASDYCKENRHILKVMDAVKRFYKCKECGNRTVTLDKVPTTKCGRCESISWVRTTMMDEKRTEVKTKNLSIRGDEEKFYGTATAANINLIVLE